MSNLKLFQKHVVESFNDKQKRVVEKYDSVSKLRSVMRWKERLARKSITSVSVANDLGIPKTRISEYLNFKREPKEQRFLDIERAIYNRGG